MRILAETLRLDKCIVRKWCKRKILHLLYCLSKESYTFLIRVPNKNSMLSYIMIRITSFIR